MKKSLFILTFILFILPINCFASPKTFNRTAEDYRVPKNVEVTFDNIPTIMLFPSVDEQQKVYDFTDSLTDEEEKNIGKKLTDFYNTTGLDSVIVFTNDIYDLPISEYTYNFYDYNYFNHNGIIFVIHLTDGDPEIFMGTSGSDDSKVFDIYSDENITQILKYVYTKNISNNEYYDACVNYEKLTEAFYVKADEKKMSYNFFDKLKTLPWPELFIIAFALTFIVDVLIVTKYNVRVHRKKNLVKNSVNNTTMIIKKEYDKLVEMKK